MEETQDEFGRKLIKTQWVKCEGDLNLGSMKEPQNQKVIAMEWIDKGDEPKNPFDVRTFFGGFR